MGLIQPTSRRPTDATAQRRRSSVVVRQFLRKDPVAWKIRVNFEAHQSPKLSSLVPAIARRSTVNDLLLPISLTRKEGRSARASSTALKPEKPSQKIEFLPEKAPSIRVHYIFGPEKENGPDATTTTTEVTSPTAHGRRRTSAYSSPTRIRKRFTLPIAVNGPLGTSKVLAFPDTGCDHNIVSLELTKELGLAVQELGDSTLRFSLANGRIVEAIGKVTTEFGFAATFHSEDATSTGLFYVFKKLAVPVIIGRKLLEETHTLTKHRHRLIEEVMPSLQVLKLSSEGGHSKQDLLCQLDSHIGYAIADTGSDLDLVTPEFAKSKGFGIEPAFERVQFADGSYGVTCGVIKSRFAIGSHDESRNFIQRGITMQRQFYVLDGLTSEILVGLDTLEKLNVYDQHSDSLIKRLEELSLADANIIRYVGSAEHLTREAWRKIKDIGSKKAEKDTAGQKNVQRNMLFEDQRENARREAARLLIAGLKGEEKVAAQDDENRRMKAFDEERDRQLEERNRQLEAQKMASKTSTTTSTTTSQSDATPSTSRSETAVTCQHPGCTEGPFSNAVKLEAHWKLHRSKFPFTCPVEGCPRANLRKGFSTEEQKTQHGLIHRQSGYVCPFCGEQDQEYESPRLLSRHVLAVHDDVHINEPLMQEIFNADLISRS